MSKEKAPVQGRGVVDFVKVILKNEQKGYYQLASGVCNCYNDMRA